ncbi:hypothetical protein CEY16_08510 [Halalkalibacillus sediminis]|uniref:Beta-lactamase-related domain-containing protein n=1 Tax=Halalkalibacillus sediminis TaxID=2018042 RepID=A0A2I0QUF3_9BACI|nr:serine hydrolase domain-containing protein [Halalkalibacillus sediminis]PKR77956.1 hypothetical protein CEY16_08510 [Halalkalibacillus sediminis]
MNNLKQELNELLEEHLNEEFYTGAVCYVKVGDEEIYLQPFGYTDRSMKQEVTNETVFDLASLTKISSSTLILKLITSGKIKLDSTLGNCLPQVKNHPALSGITIFQLLTHSSGLKAWHPFYSHLPNEDLFEILEGIELLHEESTEVLYSDLNYILLGKVIDSQYSKTIDQVVKEELAEPLETETLSYGPVFLDNIAATEFGNRTEMKMCQKRGIEFNGWRSISEEIIGEVNDGNTYYFLNGRSGHAGLFGTVFDVSKLGELYLKDGTFNDKQLISSTLTHESMVQQIGDRGYGWHMGRPFPSGAGHTGFTGTSLWVDPDLQLNVVLLTNRLNVEEPKNIQEFRLKVFNTIKNNLN